MRNRMQTCRVALLASLAAVSAAGIAQARGDAGPPMAMSQPMAVNMSDMKFMELPGAPTCAQASVLSGDPEKGPSIMLAKAKAGCAFPWHWHTPNENVMMVSGTGRIETKDGKPAMAQPGAYAMMPSKHVHQFRCMTPCALYLYADGPFDMHYVDAQGKEMSPDDALKAVKETAAKAPPPAKK